MIATALAVFNFARGNWQWLAIAGALAWGGWQYIGKLEFKAELADCRTSAAKSIADAEKAAREFRDRDYAHSMKLVADYAGEVAELQERFNDAQAKLNRAPSVAACLNTPAGRAFDDGVRALERDAARQAGDSDAPGPARAPHQVPAPAGPAGKVRR